MMRKESSGKPQGLVGRDSSTAIQKPYLLTEKEVAKMLGFSVRTCQAWRARGGGPRFVKISSRCVRYRREDLDTWIEERLRRSTSDDGSAEVLRKAPG